MYDYVIIGGGISGLFMYSQLIKKTKNILLLERNKRFGGRILQHEEVYKNKQVSIPAGAARFNKNHIHVIRLLKEYNMLDFRKEKGFSSDIEYINTHSMIEKQFEGKNGFYFIHRILNKASREKKSFLIQYTFSEYASLFLSKRELDFLLIASGYSGQLKYMNMYDAYRLFLNGIRNDITYFAGKFHILIKKMEDRLIKNGGVLLTNSLVKHISFDTNYKIQYNNTIVHSKTIILCIPKPALLSLPYLKPYYSLFNKSVNCKSLCRVYAMFDPKDTWYKQLKKTVVDNPLRYIIPFDSEKGIVMISYTDDMYTKYWKDKNKEQIKTSIVKWIKKTYHIQIQPPLKVWTFFWDCGVAYWNKNIDSDVVSKQILHLEKNMFICGENYSQTQSWVEGALETCHACLKLVK